MIKKISNITFRVSDLKKATSFYENILGLNKTAEWPDYVTFDVSGVLLGLEPGGKKGRKEDLPDIYLTVDDVDVEYKRLKEKASNSLQSQKTNFGVVEQPRSSTQTRTCSFS